MILTKILRPGCIQVPLQSTDKDSAIGELIDLLDNEQLLKDKHSALEAVLMRERTRSTGIGSQIAIPHGKCSAVKELVMALGVAAEPIDFDSVDGKPVKIVILLVSPEDQTGPHIQALAKISRLILDEDFKTALQEASSPEEAYDLISQKEAE